MKWRIRIFARLERVADDDKEAAEKLAAGPDNRAAGLRPRRERHFDQPLERDRQEAEAGRSEHAEDDIRGHEVAGPRRPNQGEVGERDDGNDGLDEGEVCLGPVDQRRADGGRNEADEDQQRATDAGLAIGETVRLEDLGENGRGRIEETDVGGKGEKEEVEVRVGQEEAQGLSDRGPGMRRGGR